MTTIHKLSFSLSDCCGIGSILSAEYCLQRHEFIVGDTCIPGNRYHNFSSRVTLFKYLTVREAVFFFFPLHSSFCSFIWAAGITSGTLPVSQS
jgi:hypothetical protein